MNADINACGQPFINTSGLCQPRKCWGSISHYVRYVDLIQDWCHKVLILDAMVANILYNSSVCQYLKYALNILSIWYLFGKLSCPVTDTRELPQCQLLSSLMTPEMVLTPVTIKLEWWQLSIIIMSTLSLRQPSKPPLTTKLASWRLSNNSDKRHWHRGPQTLRCYGGIKISKNGNKLPK